MNSSIYLPFRRPPRAFFQGPDEGKAAEGLQIKFKKAFILKVGQVQNWHLHEPENKWLLKCCLLDFSFS